MQLRDFDFIFLNLNPISRMLIQRNFKTKVTLRLEVTGEKNMVRLA